MFKKIYYRIILKYYDLKKKYAPLFFSKTSFRTGIYYSFFSDKLNREHRAVLAGITKHKQHFPNRNTLVRNVHRLEKGLTMRPLRKIFGVDYIRETVLAYKSCQENNFISIEQMHWIDSVLKKYFNTVDNNNDSIKESFQIFNEICISNTEDKTVYKRDSAKSISINYEDFLSLCKKRRSVRWFNDKPVERDKINMALTAALQAPSACNRQPFKILIFDDPEMVQKVSTIPMGTVGYAHNIPVIAVIVGDLSSFYDERDRHLIYIDSSLFAMSLMLGLETLGLSSCPINWPDIESKEKEISKKLNLNIYERPIMMIAIGYADINGLIAYSEKKTIEEVAIYNHMKE